MSPLTFEYIMDFKEQNMGKTEAVFQKAVPIEKRVGIGLWRLLTGNSFCTINKVFGIEKSTVINWLMSLFLS